MHGIGCVQSQASDRQLIQALHIDCYKIFTLILYNFVLILRQRLLLSTKGLFLIEISEKNNISIKPSLKVELLGRVVQNPTKLTQDERKF